MGTFWLELDGVSLRPRQDGVVPPGQVMLRVVRLLRESRRTFHKEDVNNFKIECILGDCEQFRLLDPTHWDIQWSPCHTTFHPLIRFNRSFFLFSKSMYGLLPFEQIIPPPVMNSVPGQQVFR